MQPKVAASSLVVCLYRSGRMCHSHNAVTIVSEVMGPTSLAVSPRQRCGLVFFARLTKVTRLSGLTRVVSLGATS